MKICVQGLWHLGTVTAVCMAAWDHEVKGLDFDHERVMNLQQGKPPLFEPGLEDLLQHVLATKKLKIVTDPKEALHDIDVLWVTYDTPVDEEDQADVTFVMTEIERVLPYLPIRTIVLISSQMPVGSIRRLEKIAETYFPEKNIEFAYSPENLRLGQALTLFQQPDRIVVGIRNKAQQERLHDLLSSITSRIEWMSIESAEMTKHAINAFLAVSVTFANEIAAVCELVGADAKEVERGLKSENRIGPKAYLSPGRAFAGGTLARDITFLNHVSEEKKLPTPLLSAVKPSNHLHKDWIKRKLQTLFPTLTGCAIAVWGLTYKPGTDTLRRSMAVELCDWLLQQGADLRVHDPVVKNLPAHWSGNLKHCRAILDTLLAANVLIICTEWPHYQEISSADVTALAPGLTVIDTNRFLSTFKGVEQLRYVAVGSV